MVAAFLLSSNQNIRSSFAVDGGDQAARLDFLFFTDLGKRQK